MPKLNGTPVSGASKRFAGYKRGASLPGGVECDCPMCRGTDAEFEARVAFWALIAVLIVASIGAIAVWGVVHQ